MSFTDISYLRRHSYKLKKALARQKHPWTHPPIEGTIITYSRAGLSVPPFLPSSFPSPSSTDVIHLQPSHGLIQNK